LDPVRKAHRNESSKLIAPEETIVDSVRRVGRCTQSAGIRSVGGPRHQQKAEESRRKQEKAEESRRKRKELNFRRTRGSTCPPFGQEKPDAAP